MSASFQNDVAGRRRAFSASKRPAGPPSGRAEAGRWESWQQEGVGSHKVATQSSRLACLSRVNIAPRLHTVMTNRGGRAQKHYQDFCLVLPDPTHAVAISGKADKFLKTCTRRMKREGSRRRFRQRACSFGPVLV